MSGTEICGDVLPLGSAHDDDDEYREDIFKNSPHLAIPKLLYIVHS